MSSNSQDPGRVRDLKTLWVVCLLLGIPWFGVGASALSPDELDEDPPSLIEDPKPGSFSVCYNHGCSKAANTGLDPEEWARVRRIFEPPPASPQEERKRLARAIALMEDLVGARVRTDGDRGGNLKGVFAPSPQQDCIDESTNSTTYLRLMEDAGLLRWHGVERMRTRGFIIFGFPHNTAVVRDLRTDNEYAVDSWFFDNGVAPVILPLEVWSDGWHPGDPVETGRLTNR